MMARRNSLISFLTLLLAVFTGTACRANNLAVGQQAKVNNEFEVPISKLENFNYLTREQILGLRKFNVMKCPQLLSDAYEPSNTVFAQIVDNKPWWGMRGAFLFGSGERSIEGDS